MTIVNIYNAQTCSNIFFHFQNSLSLTEDSGISESGDNDNEETILIKLRRLAQDLENKLTPDSHLLREITEVKTNQWKFCRMPYLTLVRFT